MSFVLGVDAGGTSTRAVAVAADGTVLGTGRSGGGNPNSHPVATAVAHLAEAVGECLTGLDVQDANACVVGMAGTSKLTDPAVAELFEAMWRRLGLTGVQVRTDPEVAFASATSAVDGTVLVAGTGSIAGRIRKRRLVSTVGGYGWLLGDEGSAFWLGREAVRTTLEALSGTGELGELARAVLAEAGVEVTDRATAWKRLITVANAEAPIRLARFAPLVSAAPDAGPILDRAADLLADMARAAREPGEDTPVVLVGSVLNGPVGERVRARLADLEVLTSDDGVLGAAWLAAVEAYGEHAARPTRPRVP
ncbi:N-acetylglucosamine kinase-like BadF-type ATPase [Amycolatopsis bartoniae]|uniref:N-acetylglucosamine kinase n=1 Tax=Amycolatopsis bartoniae TaxID=941986 RepID=A0A8H9MEL1_9PSEU|nr:BadF/BadG/BcrA/BcrD ATPase family protein [Amycolatopsis bartoniae]MBB2935035.1 N-acetylglucosamine kinase-like BadF-type ATPase [Amycolatopsis bartoniae]TVT00815.1 N-acetylglucosamine kinase [Amycolatopsis bartoniae]GHF73869.1 N-acetylglucosamine kinase [Amycolatopsis bartoniae]